MSIYTRQFLEYIAKFAREHRLWTSKDHLALAVSGGPDSTALALLGQYLLINREVAGVRIIHINHGHREGLENEAQAVRNLGAKLGLEVIVCQIPQGELDPSSNFEFSARLKRHEMIFAQLKPLELVLSAHHLDDSYEWWLRQTLTSSNSQVLGIPLVNGRWRRPFLAATKQQLFRLLKKEKHSWLSDPTSLDEQYERNFLRAQITARLDERYPKRLRHYARRSNQLAHLLGSHILSRQSLAVYHERDQLGGDLVFCSEWSEASRPELLLKLELALKNQSTKFRGTTRGELLKCIEAVATHKKGPMSFSGGVKAYLFPQAAYFINEELERSLAKLDQKYTELLKDSQIPKVFDSLVTPQFFLPQKSTKSWRVKNPLFRLSQNCAEKLGFHWKYNYQLKFAKA